MYLYTAYRISSSYYIGTSSKPFQGGIQGNSVVLVAWFILSIFLVRFLYLHKLVLSHTTPISLISYTLASLLYVDDTDVFIRNLGSKSISDISSRAQKTLDLWRFALHLTSGDLKL